jgi:hypothetical protein
MVKKWLILPDTKYINIKMGNRFNRNRTPKVLIRAFWADMKNIFETAREKRNPK